MQMANTIELFDWIEQLVALGRDSRPLFEIRDHEPIIRNLANELGIGLGFGYYELGFG